LLAAIGLGAVILGVNLWAGYHFRSAQDCLDRYHDAEGLEHLRDCLAVWPHDPETLLLAARASRRLGAFANARDYLDRYESARGEDDNSNLEWILLQTEQGELDGNVAQACATWMERSPASAPLVLEARARGYLRRFRLSQAMACLKEWLRRQPDNPQAFFLEGKVLDQNLDVQAAMASYRRVLRLDPEQDEARILLASHLLEKKGAQEALSHLKYLSQRQLDQVRVRVLMAKCLVQLGKPARAAEILDEVLAENPREGDALAERGSLALQRKQTQLAEGWLRRAVAVQPDNYEAHYQLAQALRANGKKDEARQLDDRTEMMQKDIRRIREIVMEKMQEKPHDPALHYECGTIFLRAGNVREGLRWLHSALEQDPDYLPAHKALAEVYQKTGNPGRAAQHRQAADAAARKRPASAAKESPLP
jgi:tetratricopeptide (TPR) repeat protein